MFKILSLDGGGIKGVFTASVLTAIEDEIKAPIGEYFDLIAGTSTGGIMALGLGLGFPANRILKFYREMGPEIFPSTGRLGIPGLFRQLFRLLWRYLLVSVIVPPSELRRPRWMLQSFRSGRAGSRD